MKLKSVSLTVKVGFAKDTEGKKFKAIKCHFRISSNTGVGYINPEIDYEIFKIVDNFGDFLYQECGAYLEAFYMKIGKEATNAFISEVNKRVAILCQKEKKLWTGLKKR